ncbi:MAG: DUF2513 domain-containing protein [Burkholderiales bacterium]
MKRNLDLIRKLVMAVEDLPTGTVLDDIEIDGYSPEEIGYHSYLVVDAGLAKGINVQTLSDTSPNWQILHLTSEGHDFADAARNESNWNKAKGIVTEKGGGATLEIVKQVLIGIIKHSLGL